MKIEHYIVQCEKRKYPSKRKKQNKLKELYNMIPDSTIIRITPFLFIALLITYYLPVNALILQHTILRRIRYVIPCICMDSYFRYKKSKCMSIVIFIVTVLVIFCG